MSTTAVLNMDTDRARRAKTIPFEFREMGPELDSARNSMTFARVLQLTLRVDS
jgi:hypothetical protein